MKNLYCLLVMVLLALAGAGAHAQGRELALQTTHTDDTASGPTPAPVAPAPVVYFAADVMPTFPGGTEAQMKFLREKLHYPEEALRKGISGKVLVQFVVDERGHLLDPQIVRGLGAGLDEEALRLVRIMPWWQPGLVGGKPVKVSITLPIVFRALE